MSRSPAQRNVDKQLRRLPMRDGNKKAASIQEAAFDGFDSVKCTCGAGGAAVLAQAVPGHREYEHGDAGVEGRAQLWLEDHDDEAEDLCPDAEQRDIREERRLVAQRPFRALGDLALAAAVLAPADRDPGNRAREARYGQEVRVER